MDVEFGPLVASDAACYFNRFLLRVKATGYPVGTGFAYSPLAIARNDVLALSCH